MGILELLELLETCLWLLVIHWRRGQWGGIECSEEVISEEDLANLIRAHIFIQITASTGKQRSMSLFRT